MLRAAVADPLLTLLQAERPLRILFLDNDPRRHSAFALRLLGHDLTNTHSVSEALAALGARPFDVVFLDYDLGPGQPKGLEVARRIVSLALPPQLVIIHSLNPLGAFLMIRELRRARIPTVRMPFGRFS